MFEGRKTFKLKIFYAITLKEYGITNGYSLSSQFYSDLAWGGLTHSKDGNEMAWFAALVPSAEDRKRIIDTINIELTGENLNGDAKVQKGDKAGC